MLKRMVNRLDRIIQRRLRNSNLTYHESPAYEIAAQMKERGYAIADENGKPLDNPKENVIGILREKRLSKIQGMLHIELFKDLEIPYLGNLWLNDTSRGASPTVKWVLEAYGKRNVPKLIDLCRRLNPSVNIEIILKNTDTKYV